jgi:hypothetical protein
LRASLASLLHLSWPVQPWPFGDAFDHEAIMLQCKKSLAGAIVSA